MHVTHHIPKILSGDFLQGMSGGSLEFWLEHFVAKENGLDREEVWKNVKKSLGIWMLGARENICTVDDDVLDEVGAINSMPLAGKQEADKEVDTAAASRTSGKAKGNAYITDASACKSHGFHFTADMIVDSNGRAWVMEVHLTLGIKSPGLGDPEAGYDELLTRETRQGVMGAVSMSFARFMDLPFRLKVLDLVGQRGGGEMAEQKNDRINPSPRDDIVHMIMEDRMLCRLDTESVFPKLWRDFTDFEEASSDRSSAEEGDTVQDHRNNANFISSRSPVNKQMAQLYQQFDETLAEVKARISDARTNCRVLDFNRDRVWKAEHTDFF
ncbi:unnamed protein product [Amoebophrya sp. A120]|nr:unnamed protein product [Amoebophrya sp. A120]|eukprot:GSA120T00019932001.1